MQACAWEGTFLVVRARFALRGCATAWGCGKGSSLCRCGLSEGYIGHFSRNAFEREVFAKRIERIAFPHHDATKIWVT